MVVGTNLRGLHYSRVEYTLLRSGSNTYEVVAHQDEVTTLVICWLVRSLSERYPSLLLTGKVI